MTYAQVIYPPSGVIPFHGFCMFAAPMCYVSPDPAQLYATFKAMYLRCCSSAARELDFTITGGEGP